MAGARHAAARSPAPHGRSASTNSGTDNGGLDLITGGRGGDDHTKAVLDFEWRTFFEEQAGGDVIEGLRQWWAYGNDSVLIDSRTGITDTGGICTIHLPDILVPVFTANEESLIGAVEVTERALRGRQLLAREPGPFQVLPLLSRFDDRTEVDLASKSMQDIADAWRRTW